MSEVRIGPSEPRRTVPPPSSPWVKRLFQKPSTPIKRNLQSLNRFHRRSIWFCLRIRPYLPPRWLGLKVNLQIGFMLSLLSLISMAQVKIPPISLPSIAQAWCVADSESWLAIMNGRISITILQMKLWWSLVPTARLSPHVSLIS